MQRGYSIPLTLSQPSPQSPAWAIGLRFTKRSNPVCDLLHPGGQLPPLQPVFGGTLIALFAERDSADLSPGGTLPIAQVGLTGQLAARCFDRYVAVPAGALPQPVPGFAGTASGFYAELHCAAPGGAWPASVLSFAGQLAAPYDSRVQRPLARLAQALRFEQAGQVGATLGAVFEEARSASAKVRDVVQQAQRLAAGAQMLSQQALQRSLGVQARTQDAQPLRRDVGLGFQNARGLGVQPVAFVAQQARALGAAALAYAWQTAALQRCGLLARYETAGIQRGMGLRVPPVLPIGLPGWGIALEFAPEFIAPRTWSELQSGPLVSGAALAQRLQNATAVLRYQDDMRPLPALRKEAWPPAGGEPEDPTDPPRRTIVITARRAYIVQNSITLMRLDTGAELHAHSFSMSLDYQSWTWSWQASLHHTAAAHLGRDAQGDPAELLATVNGVPFRLRLERVARERRHLPQERYSVSGKGRAAVLDAPWAPQMSFGNPAGAMSALQLALQALTINNVSSGWRVDWQLDDWLVPAGAWALQGSYIAAINDIAQSVGGYVQPHNTDPVLRILHKYPAAPWEWGDVTPDFEIPAALAEVESTEYLDKPAYNRVFVGGVGTGLFGPMTRAGTAGNVLAPQATHPLITAAEAWRQRARAELSDVGKQERIRISLPVLPETGVITPGQFVRYRTGPQQTTTGIVRGTAIDWQRPRLRQTLEIEAHEPV